MSFCWIVRIQPVGWLSLYIQCFLFCLLGGHGAMAPASTPPHIPSLHSVAAAGPLPTTDRQSSRSLVITHPAGKGIIVFVNIMC